MTREDLLALGAIADSEFAETLAKTTQTLVCVLDRDGRILLFNEACERATGPDILPPESGARLGAFCEFVSLAVASAQARDDPRASRARLVKAGDIQRQRLERNLHDGARAAARARRARERLPVTVAVDAPDERVPASVEERPTTSPLKR